MRKKGETKEEEKRRKNLREKNPTIPKLVVYPYLKYSLDLRVHTYLQYMYIPTTIHVPKCTHIQTSESRYIYTYYT